MPSHFKDRVYLACPVLIQNILVSIFGYFEHNNRYKGSYQSLSDELFENEYKSLESHEKNQQNLLEKALLNAIENVPHYRNLGIKTTSIDKFPILSRDEVFTETESLLADQFKKSKLMSVYTGGSTGTPLRIRMNKEVRQKSYAFWNRFYRIMGFQIGDKKATLVGRKLQEPDNNKPPFWRYNYYDKQLLFSSFHMTNENIPLYINKLNQFKPVIIEGYPLSVLRLAEYILEKKVTLEFQLKGISTSSENFSLKQRITMEKAFNCNVYDQYGSGESVIFAAECEHKNKHISPEYGYVEVLDENGELRREGEGELIVTSLINNVMPLIRYRIGDLGKVSYKSCKCGRNTAILEELYGKVGSVIVAEGKRVSTAAISIAFEYLKNVKKCQIIQNEPGKAIINLVTTPDFNKEEEDFMLWELKKMLSDKMEFTVNKVDNILPGENGKYQMVIQNYYKD